MRPKPRLSPAHAAAAALCVGLAGSNLVRPPFAPALVAAAALAVGAVLDPGWRAIALLGSVMLVGAAWGGGRLEAIDRSPLARLLGTAARARVEVTAPARRSRFDQRVPAVVVTWGRFEPHEPILLKLPPGRAPPQGAILEVVGRLTEPRGPKNGFDERTWLRRRGVHAVLRADEWRIVGHRGGLGGVADRLHARIGRSIAPGLEGERAALLEGVVLGDDGGLSQDLRDRFRAAGLYHLLRVLQVSTRVGVAPKWRAAGKQSHGSPAAEAAGSSGCQTKHGEAASAPRAMPHTPPDAARRRGAECSHAPPSRGQSSATGKPSGSSSCRRSGGAASADSPTPTLNGQRLGRLLPGAPLCRQTRHRPQMIRPWRRKARVDGASDF